MSKEDFVDTHAIKSDKKCIQAEEKLYERCGMDKQSNCMNFIGILIQVGGIAREQWDYFMESDFCIYYSPKFEQICRRLILDSAQIEWYQMLCYAWKEREDADIVCEVIMQAYEDRISVKVVDEYLRIAQSAIELKMAISKTLDESGENDTRKLKVLCDHVEEISKLMENDCEAYRQNNERIKNKIERISETVSDNEFARKRYNELKKEYEKIVRQKMELQKRISNVEKTQSKEQKNREQLETVHRNNLEQLEKRLQTERRMREKDEKQLEKLATSRKNLTERLETLENENQRLTKLIEQSHQSNAIKSESDKSELLSVVMQMMNRLDAQDERMKQMGRAENSVVSSDALVEKKNQSVTETESVSFPSSSEIEFRTSTTDSQGVTEKQEHDVVSRSETLSDNDSESDTSDNVDVDKSIKVNSEEFSDSEALSKPENESFNFSYSSNQSHEKVEQNEDGIDSDKESMDKTKLDETDNVSGKDSDSIEQKNDLSETKDSIEEFQHVQNEELSQYPNGEDDDEYSGFDETAINDDNLDIAEASEPSSQIFENSQFISNQKKSGNPLANLLHSLCHKIKIVRFNRLPKEDQMMRIFKKLVQMKYDKNAASYMKEVLRLGVNTGYIYYDLLEQRPDNDALRCYYEFVLQENGSA